MNKAQSDNRAVIARSKATKQSNRIRDNRVAPRNDKKGRYYFSGFEVSGSEFWVLYSRFRDSGSGLWAYN